MSFLANVGDAFGSMVRNAGGFLGSKAGMTGLGGLFGGPLGAGIMGLAGQILPYTRVGYESSPGKRAFLDSVKAEQARWDRDTAYNSPEAQMQRFRDAGLNPNLIYGQGNPGNASSGSVSASPNVPQLDMIGTVMQAVMMKKEIELKDAQIDQIRKNTLLAGAKMDTEEMRAVRGMQDYQYLAERYPQIMKEMKNSYAPRMQTIFNQAERSHWENEQAFQRAQMLLQQRGLLEIDGKIKAEVLKSKEFINVLDEAQAEFIKGGQMTSQHWYQAILSMLMKTIR